MARVVIRCTSPDVKGSARVTVVDVHIRLVITKEVTGYTIQGLKGEDYFFSDPAVIVPTYKVNVLSYDEENVDGKFIFSFNVTRDAWYSLGIKDKSYVLLNRAFVPADYTKNLYGAFWIPSYPRLSGAGAFILTRYGNREIPAKPFVSQKRLDGTPISGQRKNITIAKDVMIHIGGTYEVLKYDHLGGSYGCFGFIHPKNIHSTILEAEKAIDNDTYDDHISNSEWKKVTNKILNLAFPEKKKIKILIEDRDESKNYVPKRIYEE